MDNASADLRVIKTKQAIRNALTELMAEKDISAITISELSDRAMINRKTFYRHYRSIAEVLAEFENEILSELSDILKSSNSSCLDIGALLRGISSLIERRRDFYMKTMNSNPGVFNRGKLKAMLCRSIEVALRNIGGVSDEEELRIISEYIVSGILALYSAWLDGGCGGSLGLLTETARRMTVEGLRSFVSDEKLTEIRLK